MGRKGLWVLLFAAATAHATSPQLSSITPTGGQRGTELEVSFTGERLQDAQEILCYEPGIQILNLNSGSNKVARAQVKIAADCALGEHHLRVRTAGGLSELRTFLIGPFPVVEEIEPNNDTLKAQEIALNSTVVGLIKSEDTDCFALEMKKGQRLSAEVEGMRLGRTLFDPRLTILDAEGSVLADADDSWLGIQDPFLSIIVPRDGRYVVQLREVTYGGSDKCQYRLHLGCFPRPAAIYPLGGKAGETLKLACCAEPAGEFTYQVKLPDAAQERFPVFPELDGLPAPTPNWLRVSAFPNVLANGSNHDREHATTTELQPPFALNGVIAQSGQEGWFRFPAAKGVALEVGVYARRLRSPLDSVLEIFDPAGKSIASDDDAGGVDSALKFTPADTTNYFVRIRDTLGHGGRDFGYHVEVAPAEPRLALKIPEVARNDTQSRQSITVPRGNRFATLISAKRANFSGGLVFGIEGLPQGLTMHAEPMPANVDAMPLVFEAAADAPIAGKLLDLTAIGTNGTTQIIGKFHQEIELVQGPNNTAFYSTAVDKLAVAVTQEAPFHLRIVEPTVPLVQAGSMRLEIVAERAPNFDESIEVQMVWNPPGINSQSEATIPKGATNVIYQLNASAGAEIRSWKIAALGHAGIDGGQVYVSSQLAPLEVAGPYLEGKMETVWVNPGATAKLTVNLQPIKPFEGKASIRLLGLPEKVTAPEREITATDQEVVFELTVDPKCPTGSHKNLFCAVDVNQNGQIIPHTIASGGILRITPARREATKIAAGGEKKK